MTEFSIVHDALVNDANVAAVLGDRVRPVQTIQDDLRPYAVLTLTDVRPFNTLQGFSGLNLSEMQVDIWADSMLQADAVMRTCRAALEAAGFLCVRHITDFFDAQIDPGIFRTGFVIQLFA